MRSSIFLLALFIGFVAGEPIRAQEVSRPTPDPPTVQLAAGRENHPLLISAGDMLDLTVFDTPELSAKLRVDAQGAVLLPLAGSLHVAGFTAEQATSAVESRLLDAKILKNPHASVSVLEYNNQGVTVAGEVKSPGIYPLLGAHSLVDLISAAGGVTQSAGKAITVSHRDDPEHPVMVRLENKAGGISGINFDVRPGDTILVSHAGIVYVVGDVGKPGGFLIDNNDRLTVMQAIALAQGTNRTAALNGAKLIRKEGGKPHELQVPLKKILNSKTEDVMLADGDILFVPTSGAKSALRAMEAILPSAASASIYRVP